MLEQLQQKAGVRRVLAVSADGACLPFPGGCFDAVVIARLLYLTPAWRRVQIREEARRLFEQAGIPTPFHPGVRSVTEVDQQLADLRFVHDGDVELGPGQEITHVRAECLPRLWKWSQQLFDLERNIAMPRAFVGRFTEPRGRSRLRAKLYNLRR